MDYEKVITAIRESHPDIEELYMNGQCYNFHLILRSICPTAEAWYDWIEGHIYTKIENIWYDIRGKHYRVSCYCLPLDYSTKPHRWGRRDRRRLQ